MSVHRIRFEGAASAALTVATAIADTDGVDLTSSQRPATVAGGRVRLDLTVEASPETVASAIERIGPTLPEGSTIELDPG